jgi:hypothetical protein
MSKSAGKGRNLTQGDIEPCCRLRLMRPKSPDCQLWVPAARHGIGVVTVTVARFCGLVQKRGGIVLHFRPALYLRTVTRHGGLLRLSPQTFGFRCFSNRDQ